MLALYRSQRQTEASRRSTAPDRHLDELGLDPGPELRDLERRILEHDPSLALAEAPTDATAATEPGDEIGRAPLTGPWTALHAASGLVLVEASGGAVFVRSIAPTATSAPSAGLASAVGSTSACVSGRVEGLGGDRYDGRHRRRRTRWHPPVERTSGPGPIPVDVHPDAEFAVRDVARRHGGASSSAPRVRPTWCSSSTPSTRSGA